MSKSIALLLPLFLLAADASAKVGRFCARFSVQEAGGARESREFHCEIAQSLSHDDFSVLWSCDFQGDGFAATLRTDADSFGYDYDRGLGFARYRLGGRLHDLTSFWAEGLGFTRIAEGGEFKVFFAKDPYFGDDSVFLTDDRKRTYEVTAEAVDASACEAR